MSQQFDPEKQIQWIGLEQTGEGVYRCKYSVLLVEWLKGRGLVKVRAHGYHEHTELMLKVDILPQPPESSFTPEEWQEMGRARGYVSIYKTGSVRVGGDSEKIEKLLEGLLSKK